MATPEPGPVPATQTTSEFRAVILAGAPWLPALIVGAVIAAWSFGDGGYFPGDWYPATLFFVAVLATIALAVGRALPASRPARIAIGLLAALVAWSYISVLTAGSAGAAWEQSNKLLLVLAAVWLLSLQRWTGTSAMAALGVWALAAGAACLAALIAGLRADDLRDFLVVSRWNQPLGYPNATGALAAMGFWAAMTIAVRRGIPGLARLGFFVVALFLIEFSLIPQSRGAMISLVAMTPVFVALVPDRLRALTRLAVVGGLVALTAPKLFDVYSAAAEEKPVIPVLHDAAGWVLVAVLIGAAVVGLMELWEARRPPSTATVHRASRVVATVGIVLAVAGLAVVAVKAGSIQSSLSDRWDRFKSLDEASLTIETGPRFDINQADQRYDYWRVSLNLFKERPIAGVGSGNFERRYNAVRQDEKPSRYPHQVFLRFLAENGIVGFLLFIGYVGVALGGAVRLARRAGPVERAAAAGAVTLCAGFLVHACFDWLDQFPSLMIPALGLPLVALIAASAASASASASRTRWAIPRNIAIAGVTAAILLTLGASWISVRYLDRANGEWRADPKKAFRDLDRADALNPLTPTPRLTEGSVAIQLQQPARARRAFVKALDREQNWFSWFELALLDAQAGKFGRAQTEIARAAALSATDPFVAEARRQIRARRHIDPATFNAQVRGLTLFKEKPVR